jgi:hypothetical protein
VTAGGADHRAGIHTGLADQPKGVAIGTVRNWNADFTFVTKLHDLLIV